MRFPTLSYYGNLLTARWLPESWLLALRFRLLHKAWPQMPPRTLADKMFYCLTHERNPLRPLFADKLRARDYAASKGYADKLPRLLGVYDSFDDIDFCTLPARYVVKATHGSGFVRIITPQKPLNKNDLRQACSYWLSHDYYFFRREWYYQNLPRRLMIEEYVGATATSVDYKVFVANGRVLFIQVDEDRFGDYRRTFYDTAWKRMPFQHPRRTADADIQRPAPLDAMLAAAITLTQDVRFARVDFYVDGDSFWFGEITNFPGAAGAPIEPIEWNERLGDAFGDVAA